MLKRAPAGNAACHTIMPAPMVCCVRTQTTVVAGDWVEEKHPGPVRRVRTLRADGEVDLVETTLIPLNLRVVTRWMSPAIDQIGIAFHARSGPGRRVAAPQAAGASGIAVSTEAAFRQTTGVPDAQRGIARSSSCWLEWALASDLRSGNQGYGLRTDLRPELKVVSADTMRRRMNQQDEFADVYLEPAGIAYQRMDFRPQGPGGVAEPAGRAFRHRRTWQPIWVFPAHRRQHLLWNRFFGCARRGDRDPAARSCCRARAVHPVCRGRSAHAQQLLGQCDDRRRDAATRPGPVFQIRPAAVDRRGLTRCACYVWPSLITCVCC